MSFNNFNKNISTHKRGFVMVEKKASGTARYRTEVEKQAKLKSNIPRPNTVTSNKKHNCLCADVTSNKTPSCSSIKSQSMFELVSTQRPPVQKKIKSKELEDQIITVGIGAGEPRELGMDESFALDGIYAERAKNTYCKLVLNAWRKRRNEVSMLGDTVNKLRNQVENQTVQIIVLRDMFDSEKFRVAVATGDSAHLKDRFEEELRSNKKLNSEIKSLQYEKSEWICEREKLEQNQFGLESELKSVHEKILVIKKDCFRYQADISNHKDTETELLNKIGGLESQLEQKISIINDLREKSTSLQSQAKQLYVRNKSLYETVNETLKEISECNKRNENICDGVNNLKNTEKTQRDYIQRLTKDNEIASKKVESQSKIIEELKSDLLQYEQEKQEFKDAMKSLRNQIIFGAIKTTAKLFLPVPF